MMPVMFGAANMPMPMPFINNSAAKTGNAKSAGRNVEQPEARGGDEHAARRERSRAVAVGEPTGDRPGDEEAAGQREHVDAGPQRRALEAVAVQRQPDALQPDDEHELQCRRGRSTTGSPARLPIANARMRNRSSWNIGSSTCASR